MHEEIVTVSGIDLPLTRVHTLVIGSGAAGLNAAVQLRANGIDDVLIVTEGLRMGTSINTGSDKQTYYKLALYGDDADSPLAMAETYYSGGGMHGDLALVEAGLSTRAFMHLVNLGVPFPRDRYGQFIGYKTDHDPRQRATSVGPYTSRDMCRALAARVNELGINVREGENVVLLLTVDEIGGRRAAGAVAVRQDGSLVAYAAENVILAVGGPGGLYRSSVYPEVHTGGIGLALLAGAGAQNLPESQFGLASTKFRWNVSGSFMQVMPRFVSMEADGVSGEREFLRDYFDSADEMCSRVFLKGYQWPFDVRKVAGGSSLIDILVYVECEVKHRRVFLDFRRDAGGFSFEGLSGEAQEYLRKSGALQETPFARLARMNPSAIQLYRDHGIDIESEPLEIAVCAQHNNGGLAGNVWWESTNVKHLFPVGEVNGSHGVYRPGGSALNAGQVGGFRAAEYVANRYAKWTLDKGAFNSALARGVADVAAFRKRCGGAARSWREERDEFQARMSRAGAHVRSLDVLDEALPQAWAQWRRIETQGCAYAGNAGLAEAMRNRHLCFAHAVYLEAIRFALASGVGSRGSSLVLNRAGLPVHDALGEEWRFAPEDVAFRDRVLETAASPDGSAHSEWTPRRPLPHGEAWFETDWARFRRGEVYD
ncbi:MAG: FAD-binding protein [Dehalococcoidia bacterium]|jgi:succinate dehydrogenase/fumarate reductase flavoprotein subunit|nr:FAD-binding protein [Dehalococcoidia bacterium]